jgi:nitrilase
MSNGMKIACLQLNSQQSVADNLALVKQLSLQAIQRDKVQAITLPENAFCHPYDARFQAELDAVLPALQQFAREQHVWMFAGTIPTSTPSKDKVFSRLHAIDSAGNIAAHYDKLHLFDVHVAEDNLDYCESDTFVAGTNPVTVETPWGNIGLAICYDLRFPELFLSVNPQPFAWIVPSAFTFHTGKKHWQHLLSARAVDNFAWIIAPDQCGNHSHDRRTFGHTSIVNPDGDIIVQRAEGEGYVVATLDDALVRERRAHIPLAQHRKITLAAAPQ